MKTRHELHEFSRMNEVRGQFVLIRAIRVSFLRVVLMATIGALIWCGCTSPTNTAYKTELATQTTIEVAMKIWAEYVEHNHPPVAVEEKVKAAYEQYQRSMLMAVDISRHAAEFAGPEEAEAALKRAIAAASAAHGQLQQLIETALRQSKNK